MSALKPFLPEYWCEFIDMTQLASPRALDLVYPRWLPMLANRGATEPGAVRTDVLNRADMAILNCYYAVESITHPDLSAAVATAVNCWLQAEWLDRDDSLLGSAVVVPEYPDTAVEEIERIAEDNRFVQVLVPARSPQGYGHRRYWPIWEAAAKHGLVLGITFGGITGAPPTTSNWLGNYFEDYTAATLAYQSQILSLIMQGAFEHIPTLRVAMIESGWTWVPALMWRMDQWWRALRREVPWVITPPSAYVRRNFRFTTQPSDAPPASLALRHAYEQLGGAAMLMFGSDYPHQYETDAWSFMATLPEDDAAAVCWSTPAEWYGLANRRRTRSSADVSAA